MKLKFLLLGCIAAGIGLSSCNLDSDEDDNYMNGQYSCCNLVIPSEGGDAFATRANYTMSFYYLNGTATLTTNNLSLGYGNLAFTTNAMPTETKLYDVNGKTLDVTSFSGGKASDNGVTVTNVNGYLSSIVNVLGTNDPINPAYKFTAMIPIIASYNVNYDYTVKTFMSDAIYTGTTNIKSVGSTANPFTNDGIRYRVVMSTDLKKADIIFYNAKFADRMPVTINFVLQNLDVTFNKSGYIISGKNLIPQLYEATGLTPAPNYEVTEFQFINTSDDLTVGTAMYTVSMGGAQYNGDFQGYYALTGPIEK